MRSTRSVRRIIAIGGETTWKRGAIDGCVCVARAPRAGFF